MVLAVAAAVALEAMRALMDLQQLPIRAVAAAEAVTPELSLVHALVAVAEAAE